MVKTLAYLVAWLATLTVTPSMPQVPSELVNLFAKNHFVDFKFLLPTNLTAAAAQPLISLQTLVRIPSSKLAVVKNFLRQGCFVGQSMLRLLENKPFSSNRFN